MPPDEFREWLTRLPFCPFSFIVLEETQFDVLHPDMVLLKPDSVAFYPHALKPLEFAEEPVIIAMFHITRIQVFGQKT